MRIGLQDLSRRQKFNKVLKTVNGNPTKEVVQSELLSSSTSSLIEKCNWRLREVMIRKVRKVAAKHDIEVEEGFGQPLTQAGREAKEKVDGAAHKEAKAAHYAAIAEEMAVIAQANAAKAEKKDSINEMKKNYRESGASKIEPEVVKAPEPEPVPEPVVAEAPKEAAPAPAAAAPAEANAITPKTIKALRDITGAGMMDCKKALIETDGDQDAAMEYLRSKGLAKADKKAARVAAEGKIAFASSGNKAVMVEVNCETDFVGKDSSFLAYCDKVAGAALAVDGDSVESLMAQEVDGESLEATRQAMVAKIGENIQVRRMSTRGGEGSTVGCYVHMNRIGVLVELEGGSESLCTDVAMHVAAMNPPFATADDVSADVLEKEKKFLSEQALESGKPPEIVEKMVEGRIRKYLEEICLVSQAYVRDGDKTVGKLLEENGAKMIGFTRVEVGEGIEKKEDDFAAEVAKMAGASA